MNISVHRISRSWSKVPLILLIWVDLRATLESKLFGTCWDWLY